VSTDARQAANPRNVVVLGSTGSIGTSCLDVVAHLPRRLRVLGLSAPRLTQQDLPSDCQLLAGEEGIRKMVADPDVDVVVSAIVGAAGLAGTWAALEAGKTVAVANKETLVMAGPLVTELAARRGGRLLPVDSEHSAIFQCLQGQPEGAVERIVLTASGGPFRGKRREELENVTVTQALEHPTWRMGPKITIDSATLMNKALEVIEARWLFGLDAGRIGVILHPESVIHSFVELCDGSVLAQLSPPDMRLPIQYALTYPDRVPGPARRLDWAELTCWHFAQPDHETFPSVQLGFEVARRGGTCGAVLNAANETAVRRFLDGELPFLDIPRACRAALDHHDFDPSPTLADLLACDRWARQEVARWTSRTTRTVPKR
jgi:1-deoxy-D-xylulose-5-phosphate reductoisomerase